MKERIMSILVCLIVIIPIPSVFETAHENKITRNIESIKLGINLDIVDIINQVDKSLISYYLEGLVKLNPRLTGSENCSKAAVYINNEFKNLGLPSYIDPWNYLKYNCQNIIALFNGTDSSNDDVFVLLAHYDTIGDSPGANDDGSGVAAMLTIANICSKYTFNHTIRFVVTSGEEVGLYGSYDYARKSYERNENIVAVINIDTIGNTTKEGENIVYLLKPERSEWISSSIKEISETYKDYIGLSVVPIGNRGNDHQSFLNFGYDAIQFVQLARGDYPIHTPQDTIEKINYEYLIKVTKLILATTVELASKPIDLQVRIVTPKEGYLYLFDQAIFQPFKLNVNRKNPRGLTYIIGRITARVNITTKEEINSVAFSVDGIPSFSGFLQKPPYEWIVEISPDKIFPLASKHILGVYVCTNSGKIAYDEMDILIITLY